MKVFLLVACCLLAIVSGQQYYPGTGLQYNNQPYNYYGYGENYLQGYPYNYRELFGSNSQLYPFYNNWRQLFGFLYRGGEEIPEPDQQRYGVYPVRDSNDQLIGYYARYPYAAQYDFPVEEYPSELNGYGFEYNADEQGRIRGFLIRDPNNFYNGYARDYGYQPAGYDRYGSQYGYQQSGILGYGRNYENQPSGIYGFAGRYGFQPSEMYGYAGRYGFQPSAAYGPQRFYGYNNNGRLGAGYGLQSSRIYGYNYPQGYINGQQYNNQNQYFAYNRNPLYSINRY